MFPNHIAISTRMGTHSIRPVDSDKEVMVRECLEFLWPCASNGITLSARILNQ